MTKSGAYLFMASRRVQLAIIAASEGAAAAYAINAALMKEDLQS